jgi:hypothetical protein
MNPLIDTVLLASLCIAALHWFPWPRLTRHPLPRLAAYTFGVAVILGAPSLAYLRYAPLSGSDVLALFWAAGIAAGLATVGAWVVDSLIEGMHRSADLEDAADERAHRLD